jgi:aerobic carbon-monoxide dehydrogenase medium subunit
MYPAQFDYQAPQTVDEAISLLSQNKDAKLLAGGHSLLPLMKLRLAHPRMLVDIGRIKELSGIRELGDSIALGAMTTHSHVQWSEVVREHCPVMSHAASLIGDMQVRNRGTIGGSLAHSDPAADYPAVILALGAEIDAVGPKGKRTIKAEDFFTALLTTALNSDEIITEVRVLKTSKHDVGAAYEEMPHPASRYAVVGVAVWLKMEGGKVGDVRVGITGASDHAIRASKMENALKGNALNHELEVSASDLAADGLTCLSDNYASSDYRAHLVRVYARRALTKAHHSVDKD